MVLFFETLSDSFSIPREIEFSRFISPLSARKPRETPFPQCSPYASVMLVCGIFVSVILSVYWGIGEKVGLWWGSSGYSLGEALDGSWI